MGRKVLAVEALHSNVQHICASIMMENIQDVVYVVHNAILYDYRKATRLIDKSSSEDDISAEVKQLLRKLENNGNHGSDGVINKIKIDNLLELPIIDQFARALLKINIEGFSEAQILTTSHKLFRKIDIRGVFMNWDIYDRSARTARTIMNFMEEYDFLPYTFESNLILLDITHSKNWSDEVLWLPRNTNITHINHDAI